MHGEFFTVRYDMKKQHEEKSTSDLPLLTQEQERFIKRVSWGALGLGWVWMVFSKLYIYAVVSFLILPANFILSVIFFLHGRKSSWESREWESFEVFQKKQEQLDALAVVLWVFIVAAFLLLILSFN